MNIIVVTAVFAIVLMSVGSAHAAVLPRFSKSSGKATVKKSVSKSVSVSARLRGDRKALNVTFSNLSVANNVTYILTYTTNGKDEGVQGSVDVSSGTVTRELLFGTCSAGVCKYHTGISNMRLEVTSELKSGKTAVKRFKVKV